MIRSYSSKQLTITEFDWPFETVLDKNNRWVKMSRCIPWDELAEGYYQGLSAQSGRPAKDARLVIGAVIIKHKLSLSDSETVQQIQENPYMQYFVGLSSYQMKAPFAPSLFVEIRKRMGQTVFEVFHQAIIDAHDGEKIKSESELETASGNKEPAQDQSPEQQPENNSTTPTETEEDESQPRRFSS